MDPSRQCASMAASATPKARSIPVSTVAPCLHFCMRMRGAMDGSTADTARPLVGVTGPDRGGFTAWIFTRRALRRAGAAALRITPSRPRRSDWARLEALVLGGGADVGIDAEPNDVDEAPRPRGLHALVRRAAGYLLAPLVFALRWLFRRRDLMAVDSARDALELDILAHAESFDLPVLGICRGAQIMNVRAGGTMHRDLSPFYVETSTPWTVLPRKEIQIEAGALSSALGTSRCYVNSLHYHAIDEPGAELRVVARDHARVAQAIESGRRRFWIGVQWHPEYLPQRPEQRALFCRLVAAARPLTREKAPCRARTTTSHTS